MDRRTHRVWLAMAVGCAITLGLAGCQNAEPIQRVSAPVDQATATPQTINAHLYVINDSGGRGVAATQPSTQPADTDVLSNRYGAFHASLPSGTHNQSLVLYLNIGTKNDVGQTGTATGSGTQTTTPTQTTETKAGIAASLQAQGVGQQQSNPSASGEGGSSSTGAAQDQKASAAANVNPPPSGAQ